MENLVIVESPAKAKTIEKFLGAEYKVLSSFGHIRDLKEKEFSIDIENGFVPQYVIPTAKKQLVSTLKKAAEEAQCIWLASDEDREGEAIAWHLKESLNLDKKEVKRIVFHEITKDAILNAIKNPRDIDNNLVDAQQARRVLDRIVGFELSPVLWKKIKPALSAGRVQSVTVRLIVEREREINNFVATTTYKVVANFNTLDANGKHITLKSELNHRFSSKEEARSFMNSLTSSSFNIESIEKKPAKRSPAPPFTTSTLQQEASRKFGFPVATTMRVAQSLYESGHITYMRTDSVNLSQLAISTAKKEVIEQNGEKYYKFRQYNTKSKGAQEAHEAIRPTYMSVHSIDGTAQEQKLYELIWKRTIATQMADAELEKSTITINVSNSEYKFITAGEVIVFDGFLKVYMESSDHQEEENNDGLLPMVNKGEKAELNDAIAQERFAQRPARYTEASLVRKLEELGIGRPSTYAPTISTIQQRGYVTRKDVTVEPKEYTLISLKNGAISEEIKKEKSTLDKAKLVPSDIGAVVNDFLTDNFPTILDYNFTALVEKQFDDIAEGNGQWRENIATFYKSFHPQVEHAVSTSGKKVGERELGIDPKSGKALFVKIGRFGPIAQIGATEAEEKPLFASLKPDQSIETITLEEALELFKMPYKLGTYNDDDMIISEGRFGPYIKVGKEFFSIPKTIDPLAITYDEATQIIIEKKNSDTKKVIQSFEENSIQVLNGRYGPYIASGGKNYKIPKGENPEALTLERCKEIIAAAADAPAPKKKFFKKKS